jgi:hypothetical protein
MAPLPLPPLAGLCSRTEAARPGEPVARTTAALHRLAYVKQRLAIMAAAHLPSTPEWEAKQALALHAWLDAEHAAWLYQRIAELREPAPGPDEIPDPQLERAMDEALRPASTAERLAGSYGVVRPWMLEAIAEFRRNSNPLCDQPSHRVLDLIEAEERQIGAWGARALAAIRESPDADAATRWIVQLSTSFPPAAHEASGTTHKARYQFDVLPRRDERFGGLYDTSTPADVVYLDQTRDAAERNAALLFKRTREMDVPEVIAGIVAERWAERRNALAAGDRSSSPLPWSYYVNMLRQMWDEARHATLGETALEARGVDWRSLPINVTFSYKLARYCSPVERHILLYAIEQSLMPRAHGKPYEHAVAAASGDPLSALFHDFDWADEVLHVEIARRCLRPELPGGLAEAQARADALWKRIAERLQHDPLPADDRPAGDWWPNYARQIIGREPAPLAETHVKDWRPLSG